MSDHFDRKRKSVLEYGGRLLPTFLVLNSVIIFGEKLRSVSRFVSSVSLAKFHHFGKKIKHLTIFVGLCGDILNFPR